MSEREVVELLQARLRRLETALKEIHELSRQPKDVQQKAVRLLRIHDLAEAALKL